MSKLIEHAAYLEEVPSEPTMIDVVMRMRVPKAVIEANPSMDYAGAFEEIAAEKGWNGTGSPAEFNRLHWIGGEQGILTRRIERKNLAAKIEEANAITEAMLAALLPPPPPPPEPEPE
jgi:hypothetical protein